MNSYSVYFTVFGKEMKANVDAESEDDAKRKVMDGVMKNVVFCSVEKKPVIGDERALKRVMDLFEKLGIL